MKEIAVVICCHNAEQRIAETLKCIALQEIHSSIEWEVIVVDNASQDTTASIAAVAWQEHYQGVSAHFKIVNEPRTGLTYARLTGVKSAEAEIVIFCDDDNHLGPAYVSNALQLMKNQPSTGIVGGLAKPKFSIEGREWLQDFFGSLAVGPQNPTDGFVNWVYGAGMVIRKEVFRTFKRNNINLLLTDRAGKMLSSGGDAEICTLASLVGFHIYYTSALVLLHDIPPHRLEKKYYMKAKMNTVFSLAHLFILSVVIRDKTRPARRIYSKFLFDTIKSLWYFFPRALIGKHRFYCLYSLYRSAQLTIWLLINRKEFFTMHRSIIGNLHIS